jgi:hypothetical protein
LLLLAADELHLCLREKQQGEKFVLFVVYLMLA